MIRNPVTSLRTLALAMAVAAATSSCSSSGDSGPTSPGGGGGGTSFNLGPFALQQSATLTFVNAGTFGYHCIPHRSMGMTGTVQVDASGADSALVQVGANGDDRFSPQTAHVKPGGTVRWVNVSNRTDHTVTSN